MCHLVGDSTGTSQSSQQRGIDYPDHARFSTGEPLQQSPSQGIQSTAIERGRRPSLSKSVALQKQHTIEDDEFDEKSTLISPIKEYSKHRPELEYCDSEGLFAGLRQDYAWCTGTMILFNLEGNADNIFNLYAGLYISNIDFDKRFRQSHKQMLLIF